MKDVLIPYYSETGNTQRVAEALAVRLGGELLPIEAPGLGPGMTGLAQRVVHSILKRPTRIHAASTARRPPPLILVGSPVWAARLASPARAWLMRERARVGRYAVFLTLGFSGTERASRELHGLVGHAPLETLAITERDRRTGDDVRKIDRFVRALGGTRAEAEVARDAPAAPGVVAFPRRSFREGSDARRLHRLPTVSEDPLRPGLG